MTVKLLTEPHLGCLSLKGGYTCSSESTLVKMPHCLKSHVMAQFCLQSLTNEEKTDPVALLSKFNTAVMSHKTEMFIQ